MKYLSNGAIDFVKLNPSIFIVINILSTFYFSLFLKITAINFPCIFFLLSAQKQFPLYRKQSHPHFSLSEAAQLQQESDIRPMQNLFVIRSRVTRLIVPLSLYHDFFHPIS